MRYFLLLAFVLSCPIIWSQQEKVPQKLLQGVENEPASLEYKFFRGFKYDFVQIGDSKLDALGFKVRTRSTLFGKIVPVARKRSMYRLKGNLQRLIVQTQEKGKRIGFDTDRAASFKLDDPSVIKNLLAEPFVYYLDKRGRVYRFADSLKDMSSRIKERLPKKLQKFLHLEFINQMYTFPNVFSPLPRQQDIDRGYYWTHSSRYPLGVIGIIVSEDVYQYLGTTKHKDIRCAKVFIKSRQIKFNINPAVVARAMSKLGLGGDDVKISVALDKGFLAGDTLISLETGETISKRIGGELKIKISIGGSDPLPGKIRFTLGTVRKDLAAGGG